MEKLDKAKLIYTKTSQEWHRAQLSICSTGFTRNGCKFVEAAKDAKAWREAVETTTAQIEASGYETLGPLKAALFANAGAVR